MSENELYQKLSQAGVIPVVKLQNSGQAALMAGALKRAGILAAEITFRSDAAAEAIRRIRAEVPDMLVIAGTVLNPATAETAVECGAECIVSPGLNLETVRWCRRNGVAVIPGVSTPTEVEQCMREGLHTVKFFPAEASGGVQMLRAFAGPYASMRFMPTGGIHPENLKEYLQQKNVLCCGGTWIVPEKLLEEGNYGEIERLASEAAEIRDRTLMSAEEKTELKK